MANGFCPQNCQDVTLNSVPPEGDCPELGLREMTVSRLLFTLCSTTWPAPPYTTLNLEPLIESGDIAFSQPLANATFSDPEIQKVLLSDCVPPIDYLTKRVFTAEDRYAIKLVDPSTSDITDKFFDYKFWRNKVQHKVMLRVGFMMCNGDVYMAKDEAGNLLEFAFMAFRSFERLGDGAGSIELKKISMEFKGDPLGFNEPDFNAIDLTLI